MHDLERIRGHWPILDSLVDSEKWLNLRTPEISDWSVGEQLTHVELSLISMAMQCERALRKPATSQDSGPNRIGRMILTKGVFPRGRAQAPKLVVPKGTVDTDTIRELLSKAKRKWFTIEELSDEISNSNAVSPHPLLGDFTARDWVRLAPIHTEHHLKIVREIIAANMAVPKFLKTTHENQ